VIKEEEITPLTIVESQSVLVFMASLPSDRILKTAMTLPILLLVCLPSVANRNLNFEPSSFIASLKYGIVLRYWRTSQTVLLAPSPFLAYIIYLII